MPTSSSTSRLLEFAAERGKLARDNLPQKDHLPTPSNKLSAMARAAIFYPATTPGWLGNRAKYLARTMLHRGKSWR